MNPPPRPAASRLLHLVVLSASILAAPLRADNLQPAFDQANKLYEQAKYAEAAAAYQDLLRTEPASPALYFNLGNAWFKAGQNGRAIAAFRGAEKLAPRDPNLRFNLNFVRRKVSGSDSAPAETWPHRLEALTLNEWTLLAGGAAWLWFILLALREWRPALRRVLSGYTATAGVAAAALAACLAAVVYDQSNSTEAVVIATNAVVRNGPLEESAVAYQLRDGSEVAVLDQLPVGDKKQSWVQVRDPARRVGWVQRDQVLLLSDNGPVR